MAEKIAEQFIAALAQLEADNKVEPIAALFSEKSEVGNVVTVNNPNAAPSAREFWQNYRDTFGEVKSEFRNKTFSETTASLEWTTEGTNKNGQPVNYDGVSILETDGDRITRFFAYFNPSDLGHQITEQ